MLSQDLLHDDAEDSLDEMDSADAWQSQYMRKPPSVAALSAPARITSSQLFSSTSLVRVL